MLRNAQRITATGVFILAFACAATADPILVHSIYEVRLSGEGGFGPYDHIVTDPGVDPWEAGSFGPHSESYTRAFATGLQLGVYASASANASVFEADPIFGSSAKASAVAQMTTYFVIEPDVTDTVGSVATALLMTLDGTLGGTNFFHTGHFGMSGGLAVVDIDIEFVGIHEFDGARSFVCTAQYLVQDDCYEDDPHGIMAGFDDPSNGTLITDILDIELWTPFAVRVELSAHAKADARGSAATTMTSDYSRTLTYHADGPVFLLPPGYTVNSLDGSVVNNRWVGGGAATPVPEPASVLLLAAGLVGPAARKLRRHLHD